MERDPSDGKVTFMRVEIIDFVISNVADVFILFKGLHEAGKAASEDAGHVIYPVYELGHESQS